MEPTKWSFLKEIELARDEDEVDGLCIEWLKMLCKDNGIEGQVAAKLLDVVVELLGI